MGGTVVIPTLVTERLFLRPIRRSDLDAYAALNADPEVQRYMSTGTEPWDSGRTWRHLAFLLGHWELGGTGSWAVERRADGEFLGVIGFWEPAGWPDSELAWRLARRWWGNGYATEGARAALAYAFEELGRERVISLIHPENRASIRVAERIGETLQGTTTLNGAERRIYGLDREGYVARFGSGADAGWSLSATAAPLGLYALLPASGSGTSGEREALPAVASS
jgi:RimJ/RimL family protein N-acetyltransferase